MTESKGVLNVGTLTAGGVSAPAIALLKKQGVETLDQVEGFEPHVWSHLFASGLTVADHRALMGMLKKFQKRPIPIPPPPNLAFNVGSLLLGLVFAVPSIVIGVFNEYGTYTAARPLTTPESLLLVLLPGALYLIGNVILIERFRGIFSTDVLKQRSDGVSIREAEKSGVTNMAVVAALLLTIIIAMMQSDPPSDEPYSLLSQWYQVFLYAAMVPCFAAVVLSSMLLLYVDPLDEAATLNFVGTFVDFFGEPSFAVIFGIANFVPAMTLWMFGTYGIAVGAVSSLSTVLLIRKVTLTFMYMSTWDNSELDEATRIERKEEAKQLRAAAATVVKSKQAPMSAI